MKYITRTVVESRIKSAIIYVDNGEVKHSVNEVVTVLGDALNDNKIRKLLEDRFGAMFNFVILDVEERQIKVRMDIESFIKNGEVIE